MSIFNSTIEYKLTTSNTYCQCPITIPQVTINYIAIRISPKLRNKKMINWGKFSSYRKRTKVKLVIIKEHINHVLYKDWIKSGIIYVHQWLESCRLITFPYFWHRFFYTLQRRDNVKLLATNETKFIYFGGYLTNIL